MSVFAYYLPGQAHDKVDPDLLRAVGLGDRLADCLGRTWLDWIRSMPVAGNGPDGKAGTMVAPRRADDHHTPVYKPGEWEAVESDNGQFWLCWLKGELPGPEDLRRRKLIDGVSVEMLDGREWHCPTIRKALAFPGLPCSFTRANGTLKKQVVPAYRDLWEASATWADDVFFGGGLSESKLFDICARCLAVNYRVGDEELRVLGLLDDKSMEECMRAALDHQFFLDCATDEKKRELRDSVLAVPSSSPGPEDSTPATEFREAS